MNICANRQRTTHTVAERGGRKDDAHRRVPRMANYGSRGSDLSGPIVA